jgi:serine/threonine protein phosphatase 1
MKFIKRLPRNMKGKDYIVGDLHGCYDELIGALTKIGFNYDVDRLFSVGDLIDRGPKNAECLGLLREKWFHAVRGNHEMMFYYGKRYWEFDRMWFNNGGHWASGFPTGTLDLWRQQVWELPGIIVVGKGKNRFNVLHAEPEVREVPETLTNAIIDETYDEVNEDPERTLYWSRWWIRFPENLPPFGDLSPTYMGHSVLPQLVRNGPLFYLDRGACMDRPGTNVLNTLAIACHKDKVVYEYNHRLGSLVVTEYDKIPELKQLHAELKERKKNATNKTSYPLEHVSGGAETSMPL